MGTTKKILHNATVVLSIAILSLIGSGCISGQSHTGELKQVMVEVVTPNGAHLHLQLSKAPALFGSIEYARAVRVTIDGIENEFSVNTNEAQKWGIIAVGNADGHPFALCPALGQKVRVRYKADNNKLIDFKKL